jgi:Ca2+-binding RTX toxin-like protein
MRPGRDRQRGRSDADFHSGCRRSQQPFDRPTFEGTGSFVVTDSGATVTAGPGCAAGANSHQAVCSPAGVGGISVSLGDLGDEVEVAAGCAPSVWCASTISAGAGADTITAGRGLDIVDGGPGGDLFIDTIGWATIDYSSRTAPVSVTEDGVADDGEAGEGDNVAGSFSLIGGTGSDTFSTDLNIVTLEGGDGDDSLFGAGTLRGQKGDDTLAGVTPLWMTTVEGGDGADTINGWGNLYGDAGNDTISGTPAIFGGDGNDTLVGASGTTIQPGLGSDVVSGDPDTWVTYEERSNPVTVKLDGLANDGESGEGDNIAVGIVGVILGLGNDLAEGSAGPNQIDGRAGNDTIRGFGGGDALTGGSGTDLLEGGVGDDALEFGQFGPEAWGGADDLNGGDGSDTAYYSGHTGNVSVDFDDVADDGETSEHDNVRSDVENAVGGLGNDTLTGNGVANSLEGGPGNDEVTGAGGNDTLLGIFNNDTLSGGAGDDLLVGAGGDDELEGGSGADVLDSGEGTDFVDYSSRTGDVTVTGGGADNGEPGEGDNVSLDFEEITTGSGDDNVTCGFFGCLAILGAGNDTLTGGFGPVTVFGGPGDDDLTGGDAGDTFVGEPGADHMSGGPGTDFLDYSARTDSVTVWFNGHRRRRRRGRGRQRRIRYRGDHNRFRQ